MIINQSPRTYSYTHILFRFGPFVHQTGHVSILRTDDPTVTTGTVHLSVYYTNIDIDSSTLSIHQTSVSGVYHLTLVTPHFYWGQCLVARWTIVLPYAWDNATNLVTSVKNSVIKVAPVLEELEFDNAELRTTNSWVDIGGLSAGFISIQSTNREIRGQVRPGKNLTVSTTNASIELESLREGTESIVVHTTNGRITGSYIAVKTIELETTNALIDVRAEAGILNLSTTNGPIKGGYQADTVANFWTSNGPVEAEVEAGDITIRTTNARIAGRYLARGLVDTKTSNAPIDITEGYGEEVILKTLNGKISGEFIVGTRFDAQTTNDLIDVHVNLKEDAQAPEVKATTSYGRTQVILVGFFFFFSRLPSSLPSFTYHSYCPLSQTFSPTPSLASSTCQPPTAALLCRTVSILLRTVTRLILSLRRTPVRPSLGPRASRAKAWSSCGVEAEMRACSLNKMVYVSKS